MIVSWPRTLPEGEVSRAIVEQIGLWPTLADLAGLEMPDRPARLPFALAPERFDGVSFARQAALPREPGAPVVFSEFAVADPVAQYMARGPRFKYIYSDEPGDNEFYDLETDPGESVNRISDQALVSDIAVLESAAIEFRERSKRRYAVFTR
jgi:arylsulfatase A-like enzyme